jgi:hypothetical protein
VEDCGFFISLIQFYGQGARCNQKLAAIVVGLAGLLTNYYGKIETQDHETGRLDIEVYSQVSFSLLSSSKVF